MKKRYSRVALSIALGLAGCSSSTELSAAALGADGDAGTAVQDFDREPAIATLSEAFDIQLALVTALTDPSLPSDREAIRSALRSSRPLVDRLTALLEQASQLVASTDAEPYVLDALREHRMAFALAELIVAPESDRSPSTGEIVGIDDEGTASRDIVVIRFEELQVHGAVVLRDVNLALSILGAGPSAPGQGRLLQAGDLIVAAGYTAEIVTNELDFASVVAIDEDGSVYVGEAGYSYGGIRTEARVIRVGFDGSIEEIARGFEPPLAGLDVRDGQMFVAHRGTLSRIDVATRERVDLVTGLPAFGDHFTENLAISDDGWVYFTQGTVTNTGVVGLDNYFFGWLPQVPEGHEVPCRDYTLSGVDFVTGNPLTDDPADIATTGAFLPFGAPSQAGQVIPGQALCSGAVYRIRTDGSGLEVYADGFRNPYGLALDPDGRVFVTENGPDARGSRPVEASDNLYEVIEGGWYGFPDFFGGIPITDADVPQGASRAPLLLDAPPLARLPLARLARHSASNGLDFVSNVEFGELGTAFIAQLGDLTPPTAGGAIERAGRRVVSVSPEGEIGELLTSVAGEDDAPFLRPTDATFSPSGTALYVVHFGELTAVPGAILPSPGTGALIRIRREPQ